MNESPQQMSLLFAHLSRGYFYIFVSTIEDVSQFNQDNQVYDIIQQTLYLNFMNSQVL